MWPSFMLTLAASAGSAASAHIAIAARATQPYHLVRMASSLTSELQHNFTLAFYQAAKKPVSHRLLKKVQLQGGPRWAGYPPKVGQGVLGGTPQRVPKRTNAA